MLAKRYINGNFAIINADDFYGRDSYLKAYNFLESNNYNEFGVVGFKADVSIPNGKFKRGVCVTRNNELIGINESYVSRNGNNINCKTLSGEMEYKLDLNAYVSMNMLLFTPKIFDLLSNDFINFLKKIKNQNTEEFLIPIVFDKHLRNKEIIGRLIKTNSSWAGITYREDINSVKNFILEKITEGDYNYNLWE